MYITVINNNDFDYVDKNITEASSMYIQNGELFYTNSSSSELSTENINLVANTSTQILQKEFDHPSYVLLCLNITMTNNLSNTLHTITLEYIGETTITKVFNMLPQPCNTIIDFIELSATTLTVNATSNIEGTINVIQQMITM